ncbi:MAG: PDZ domain-containing protein [Blastocatellia bacterium]|nr:PDZ domain-containing protein [Blastocatellia bacterium]
MLKRKYIIFILAAALGMAGVLAGSAAGYQDGKDKQKDKTAPEAPVAQAQVLSLFSSEGGYLGVYLEEVTSDRAKELNLSEERGALVMRVVKGSPAEAAGLNKNDVIVSFNGRRVDSVRELTRLLGETPAGRNASIEVIRAGGRQNLTAKLDKRSNSFRYYSPKGLDAEALKQQEEAMKRSFEAFERAQKDAVRQGEFDNYNFVGPNFQWVSSRSRLGVRVESLSDQLAEFFGAKDGKGILVSEVREDSPAARAGLKAGDVITAVDNEKISGVNEWIRALGKKQEGTVTFTIIRNHSEQTVTVTIEKSQLRTTPRRRLSVSRSVATAD